MTRAPPKAPRSPIPGDGQPIRCFESGTSSVEATALTIDGENSPATNLRSIVRAGKASSSSLALAWSSEGISSTDS